MTCLAVWRVAAQAGGYQDGKFNGVAIMLMLKMSPRQGHRAICHLLGRADPCVQCPRRTPSVLVSSREWLTAAL